MIPFINILIGTRGQFVKMSPVIRELDRQKVAYRIIHTGQHTASTKEMAEVFGVRHGDVFLTRRAMDITSIKSALVWFCVCFFKGIGLDPGDRVCTSNACVIHGDTMSALLGWLLAFFWGQKLVHVESGLTTGTLWIPFPEEIIRRICMASAHVMYAPGDWAAQNLAKRKVKGDVVNTGANTVLDAVRYVRARNAAPSAAAENVPYGVVTLHRNETFYSRSGATASIEAITNIPGTWRILFVMHRLTEKRLKKYGLLAQVTNCGFITILGYQRYDEFMSLVSRASFVITDGGGLQEETFYMNVPCLVLRRKTERTEGLGTSATLSATKGTFGGIVADFVGSLASRKHDRDFSAFSPSAMIVEHLRRCNALLKERTAHEN